MVQLPSDGYVIATESSTKKAQIFFGYAFILLFASMGALAVTKKGEAWIYLFTVLFIALGVYAILRARRVLVLQNDEFSISEFRKQTYSVTDFSGFRITTTQGKYGYYRRYKLQGKTGHRNATLLADGPVESHSPDDIRALKSWVTERLPDLEARDRTEEKQEQREAALYGGRRLPPRSTARRIARVLNWSVGSFAAAGYFSLGWHILPGPNSTRLISLVALLLVPATVAVKLWSPSSFQFGTLVGGGAPPGIDIALMFGALFAVVMEWMFCQPLHWSAIMLPVGAVSIPLCAVTFRFALGRRDKVPGTLGFVGVCLILYSLGAVLVVNAAFDRSRPTLEDGLVLARSESSGRGGPTYYWTIRFPNEKNFERKVRIPQRLYEMYNIRPNDPPVPVPVYVGRGALGIEWIRGFPV